MNHILIPMGGPYRSLLLTIDFDRGYGRRNRADATETGLRTCCCALAECACKALNMGLLSVTSFGRRAQHTWDQWDDRA